MGLFDKLKALNPVTLTKRIDELESAKGLASLPPIDISKDKEGNIFYSLVAKRSGHNVNQSRIIEEGYKFNADVFAIVSKVINTAASIPIQILNTLPNGEVEEVTEGDFYDFIHMPNDAQNYKQFTAWALGYNLLLGEEFIALRMPVGFSHATKMAVLPANLMTVNQSFEDIFNIELSYSLVGKGINKDFTRDEILHIRNFNPTNRGLDTGKGLSPLQPGYGNLEASNNLTVADAHLLRNRGIAGFITNRTQATLSKEAKEDLQKTVDDMAGGPDQANKVRATSANVDFVQLGMSPADLKIIEGDVNKLRKFCNIWGVDSSILNDPQNKKFSNLREGLKSLYINAVIPPLQEHIDGLNTKVVPGWNDRDNANYSLALDLSSIEPLQEDQSKRAARQERTAKGVLDIIKSVSSGDITADAARFVLVNSFDMSDQDAETLINANQNANQNNE